MPLNWGKYVLHTSISNMIMEYSCPLHWLGP
jgi:hypothetical protein